MQRRPAAFLALVLLLPALAGCTGVSADEDGDGLDTAEEQEPREIHIRTPEGTTSRWVTSDPALKDTDGDGVDDAAEVDQRTDPRDVDTDNDGLLDGHDVLLRPGDVLYNLLLARGIARDPRDGRFLGELDQRTKPFDWDGDRPFPDGLGDGDELRGWNVTVRERTYHVSSDPTKPDTDNDNLNDFEEKAHGCDPRAPDTDLDGVPDALDADCVHNLKLSIAVTGLVLGRDMDPGGGADLDLVVQAAGSNQTFTQALRTGPNNLTFRWVVDVPDQGPWHQLRVPLALEFWDRDFAGQPDGRASGVDRQPIRVAGDSNALVVQVDLFTRRWSTDGGVAGVGMGTFEGTDGAATFLLEPLLD